MDGFDKKREMVQKLMGMLKKSAADEVGGYSEKKQVTHTPLPTERPTDKPHAKESFKAGSQPLPSPKPMEGTTMGNDTPQGMAKGGMVDLTKKGASLEQPTSEDAHMAEGGLAGTDMSAADEASRLTEPKDNPSGNADAEAISNLPGPIEDEGAEKESAQSMHNENLMDEDEDNNSSAFDAFLPRKRKK